MSKYEPIPGPSGLKRPSQDDQGKYIAPKKFRGGYGKVEDKVTTRNGASAHRFERETIQKTKRVNQQSTVKYVKKPAKQYGLKGVSRLKKHQLIEKIKNGFLKEDELKKLTKKALGDLAEGHKIHFQSSTKKSEIIEAILKHQSQLIKSFECQRVSPFTIKTVSSRHIKKFSTTEFSYKIRLNKIMKFENAIFGMFKLAIKSGNYKSGDKVYIVVHHPEFHHDISVALKTNGKAGTITKDHVRNFIDHIKNILTSTQSINVLQVTFHIRITNIPRGAKGDRTKIVNYKENKHTKRSITQIKSEDNLCCPRAIIVGLTYHTSTILGKNLTPNEIEYVKKGRRIQTDLAEELCKKLEYYNEEGFTLEDIRNVERLLDIQIILISAEYFNKVIYEGNEKETKIYLYQKGNHFDVINSLTGFYASSYYCYICDKKYNNKDKHKCENSKNNCVLCSQKLHDKQEKSKIYCKKCDRYCYNRECFNNHEEVCKKNYKCLRCNKICLRSKKHECGGETCRNCEQFLNIREHKCYMVHKKQKGGYCEEECICNGRSNRKVRGCTYTEKYIFFDYEANQESGIHEANLVVAWNSLDDTKHIFKTNYEFCKWLLLKEQKGFTAVAHNAKGYDAHFILKYCVENTLKPYTIYSGSKLLLLDVKGHFRVIDSSNFVASPLAAFPKTFGLQEMKKGYFPHYFNTARNQNYVGSIPDIEFYGVDTMKPAERTEFLDWHKQRVEEKYVFDFQKELLEYCESDVDILGRGCLELRKQFLEIANIDPLQYTTIASVCMSIFRSKYLRENTIASIKEDRKDNYSVGSITWLEKFPNVKHALNGGEVTICGAKVDGFDQTTNTVYQYHGCFWHGCPKCFYEDTINTVNKEIMGDLYEKTRERSRQIKDAGYDLVEKWECEWVNSQDYKTARKENSRIIEPLSPRDAFYGGRTNAAKLKVMNKKLKYIDVCSLYPTVQYFDYYPVGHPEKISNPDTFDPNWYGLIKCKILAPRNLYHPVLPIKDEKLLFVLCRKCFNAKCDQCDHTEDERALIGTWTTDEVKKAIEKGYRIIETYEVWHFKEKSNDLFKGYVQDFMKIKLESSLWENDFETVEGYILAVRQCLGIDLHRRNIIPNPGKRAVAKICLNSLWGKFGQRLNLAKTEFVLDVARWHKLLLDDKLEIGSCVFINDNMVEVTYKVLNQFKEDSFSTNVFIAAFTTSNARLRLYDMLDRLGNKVAYYDTDSIVYIDDGTDEVKTGCMLGEWTDELGKNNYITEWVSTGPKSYAYLLNTGEEVTKVKGFTLNHENSQLLNRKSMLQTLENNFLETPENNFEKIMLKHKMITRNKANKTLVNEDMEKEFKVVYDKRNIILNTSDSDMMDTLPWGY